MEENKKSANLADSLLRCHAVDVAREHRAFLDVSDAEEACSDALQADGETAPLRWAWHSSHEGYSVRGIKDMGSLFLKLKVESNENLSRRRPLFPLSGTTLHGFLFFESKRRRVCTRFRKIYSLISLRARKRVSNNLRLLLRRNNNLWICLIWRNIKGKLSSFELYYKSNGCNQQSKY